eukprot:s5005_g5.t1
MATESGAAASAATTTAEKEGSLWNILPGFDPQQDDPREYRDKVQFLHGICPKKDRTMLAPRLAMLMKGTAWAQVKQIEPASLTDPDTGVKALLQAISTWEETEEMQLYDKFEKALYRTTQRTDETTQSFVNRLAVSFHELGTLTVKDIKAFIVLRQSALGVEDKKRVLTMAGTPMTQDGVEKAMRQLSTKVLVGQAEGRKKVYPVNFVEEEEEINIVQEHETMDEEQAIILLAEQGDDDAQLIKEFEDQLIEVCQENQDLAMCYTSYAEARTKIRERLRQKGKSKGGKKGGKGDFGRFHSKKASLAERIAASHCRRCGAKGHWKWECPAKDGNKEDVNVVTAVDVTENGPEIYGELPEGVRESSTIEELFEMMAEKDCSRSTQAMKCPGIIDTGASKTVIGQSKIKSLVRSMPLEVQKQMNWKKSETVFRFGNNAVLPSVGALFLPFGSRWMKIEVVEGDTPFLLSNSFLRAIDADVCTSNSTLRLNQLGIEVPLQANNKGLFVVELAEVISAFSREHRRQSVELVTNVTVEQRQPAYKSAAEVAQRPPLRSVNGNLRERRASDPHGDQQGHDGLLCELGQPTPVPRGSEPDLHDGHSRRGSQEVFWCSQSAPVGTDGDGRRKTQEPDIPGGDPQRPGLCRLDEETSTSVKRLGPLIQNFVKAWDQTHGQSQSVQVTPKAKALAPSRKEPPRSVWSEDEEELVMIEQGTTVPKTSREGNSMSSGKRGIGSEDVDKMQAEVNPQLVQQLQLQIAMLQDQLARVTKNTEK